MKCPIEGIECGNVSGNGCVVGGSWVFQFDLTNRFERCPFPSKIKKAPPDPGEGYEIMPYDPKTRIESDWSVWCDGVKDWRQSTRVGNNMFSPGPMPVYRRPKYAVCPVSGERCRQADGEFCRANDTAGAVLSLWKYETCPWPSKKGV